MLPSVRTDAVHDDRIDVFVRKDRFEPRFIIALFAL